MGNSLSVIVPLVTIGIPAVWASLSKIFAGDPNSENDTMQQIQTKNAEERHRQDSARERVKLEAERNRLEQEREDLERRNREQEAEQRRNREREAEQRREVEEVQRKAEQEQKDLERRNTEAEAENRRRIEAMQKKAEDERREAKVMADAREAESRARMEEAREKREKVQRDILANEEAARMREVKLMAENKAVVEKLRRGIQPVVNPTDQEFEAAKRNLEFDPTKLHFAICGASGSGKSSLINALRGMGSKDPGAAKTGAVETTSRITRYPDPRQTEYPYSRFVWYDVPGAGTLNISDWQYFNQQGLFIFEFIVLVYDQRFTKIDVGIIENCKRFNIPTFIVRSKSDQNIRNEQTNEDSDSDNEDSYEAVKEQYINDTRADARRNLKKMVENDSELYGLQDQKVYIVNHHTLRGLLSSKKTKKQIDMKKAIDEAALVEDMLRTAVERRYPGMSAIAGQKMKDLAARGEQTLAEFKEAVRWRSSGRERADDDDDDFTEVGEGDYAGYETGKAR